MSLLDELKARGVQDICIACVDGLSGFKQAIQAVFPHALVQRCLVHLIRQSTQFVSYQDRKSFCYDLKQIYQAINRQAAEQAFETFKDKWNPKVPLAVRVWENNIEEIYQLFHFPQEIRKMIDTTNSIESYNSQLRKVLKGKGAFPNEISVMKLIYLQTMGPLAENEVNNPPLLGNGSHEEMATSTFKLESNIKSIINLISRSFNTLYIILKN